MKIGDVMRVKVDQYITAPEARGQLCVIERFDLHGNVIIRIQNILLCDHYTQHVREYNLEKP